MPPKLEKKPCDANIELELAHKVHASNYSLLALQQVKEFLSHHTCFTHHDLSSQEVVITFKKDQLCKRMFQFVISMAGLQHADPLLIALFALFTQFMQKGLTSPKKVKDILASMSLPENAEVATDSLIDMLESLLHYLNEWVRLQYVKRHLDEEIERNLDVRMWCQMIFEVEENKLEIKAILLDTECDPYERLRRILAIEKAFHESHLQSHALSRWQHQIGCHLPSPSEVALLLETIRTHGITDLFDPFCGQALGLAILRMFIPFPMHACDIQLPADPFVRENVFNFNASQFVKKLLKRLPPDARVMVLMLWPPSDMHLETSKHDPTDSSPQAQVLLTQDSRLCLVGIVSDLPDAKINPCDPESTVIGSTDGEAVLSDLTKYTLLTTSPVTCASSREFQFSTPVVPVFRIFQSVHH